MHTFIKNLSIFLVLIAASVTGMQASAQTFPSRPIRLIVPYGPGGNTDLLARSAGQKLGEVLGQPILVENRPGASTLIGTRLAVQAPADGYTLFMGNNATAILPVISSTPAGYQFEDFTPLGSVGTFPMVLSVTPSLPIRSVSDLIAYDKNSPGKLNIGEAGGHTQLLSERLKYLTGLKFVDINFGGAAQALTNVAGGQIQMFIDGAPTSIVLHKGEKIRIIAVAADKRLSQIPEVATFKEQGFSPMTASAWFALFVASKTPEPILRLLTQATEKVVADPAVRERIAASGGDPWSGTAAEFDAYIKQDTRALYEDARRSGYKLP